MIDLWNVPPTAYMPDVLTARVALGMCYGLSIRYRNGAQQELARKQLAFALGIDRGTLRRYITPVLDEHYRIVSGPTKMGLFHAMMLKMGVLPSQLYGAAESSTSMDDFLGKVARIYLAPVGPDVLPAAFLPIAQEVAQTLSQLA